MKTKQIQIPEGLFFDLYRYFYVDSWTDQELIDLEKRIRAGLNAKVNAMVDRDLFTQYKTAPTDEAKEKARQEYLDRRGVPENFRRSTTYSIEKKPQEDSCT